MDEKIKNNLEQWTALLQQPKFNPKYPSERVIQWVFNNFKFSDRILDYGAGTGRHLNFLLDEGFQGYSYEPALGDIWTEDIYPRNFFDGVLCYGVLYYISRQEIPQTIWRIRESLKKGGRAMFVLRSTKDYRRYNKSIGRAFNEKDLKICFFSRRELKPMFKKFHSVQIDEMMNTYLNGKEVNHDWVVCLKK